MMSNCVSFWFLCTNMVIFVFLFQGKGLFALKKFNPGDIIFEERPLVCAQFLWNQAYGYLACDYCMKPLETAEENVRRLAGIPDLCLPYSECCGIKKEECVDCPYCEVY